MWTCESFDKALHVALQMDFFTCRATTSRSGIHLLPTLHAQAYPLSWFYLSYNYCAYMLAISDIAIFDNIIDLFLYPWTLQSRKGLFEK